jgi:prephenate dehydrogenase
MIEVYEKTLTRFKELVRLGDGRGLETEFERAKQAREQLSG